jgi:hypothetical protein
MCYYTTAGRHLAAFLRLVVVATEYLAFLHFVYLFSSRSLPFHSRTIDPNFQFFSSFLIREIATTDEAKFHKQVTSIISVGGKSEKE